MTRALASLDEVASEQWSLVTRQQLLDARLSRAKVADLLRSGALRRVGPRVYATVGSRRSWEQSVMIGVLAAGAGAVASHASAARLWRFAHLPADAVDVTIPVDRAAPTRARGGTHSTLILPATDVNERMGIPVTSFERTLCDCTTRLSSFQLGRVLDDGLRRGDASLEKLFRCAAGLDSGPGRRLGVVRELLAQRDASFDPGGSASELHVLQVIRDANLPEPVQQHRIPVPGHVYIADFAWPDRRIVVEYYGLAVHSGASSVAYDNDRIGDFVAAGWRPLVFTDATSDADMVRRLTELFTDDESDSSVAAPMSA